MTTYYSEKAVPVFDTALRYILWKGRESGAEIQPIIGCTSKLRLNDSSARTKTAEAVRSFVEQQGLCESGKQRLLLAICSELGLSYSQFLESGLHRIMTPRQISYLPEDIVKVELHTHRHRTPRTFQGFTSEVIENRSSLGRIDPKLQPSHFCYPNGDYCREFVEWLPTLGVQTATACVPGLAARDTHPLLLPRFVDSQRVVDLTFESWLAGVTDMLPRKREYRRPNLSEGRILSASELDDTTEGALTRPQV